MPKFKSLEGKSAIEAQVTDHEPLIHPVGIVSVNIMGNQMRGIAPNSSGFPNNGFNQNESPDQHIARLNLVAKMLGELAGNPAHEIFTLQEVPLPTSPAFGPFIERACYDRVRSNDNDQSAGVHVFKRINKVRKFVQRTGEIK